MRRVLVNGVTPGMRLARPVRGARGELLLAAGMLLTPRRLRQLQSRGCLLIDVEDGLTDDIEMPETISEDIHIQGLRAVHDIHTFFTRAVAAIDGAREENALQGLDSRQFARAASNLRKAYALTDAAMAIVDEVMSGEVALGLNSIRLYDQYTYEHSIGTAVAGAVIGKELNWPRDQLGQLVTGCLMHDIGKVFVDRAVLNKPGKLSEEEMTLVQKHAHLGYEAVRQIFGPGILANQIPHQHHERQDGSGYPRGLKGDNELPRPGRRTGRGKILPIAEISTLADVYDALNSDRPYRPALPPDRIIGIAAEMSGTSLNASLVTRFFRTLSRFPVGGQVMVKGPKVDGFIGVVVRQSSDDPDRPVVRLLWDARGHRIAPLEIDLSVCSELEVQSTLMTPAEALVPVDAQESARMLEAAHAAAKQEMASPSVC